MNLADFSSSTLKISSALKLANVQLKCAQGKSAKVNLSQCIVISLFGILKFASFNDVGQAINWELKIRPQELTKKLFSLQES